MTLALVGLACSGPSETAGRQPGAGRAAPAGRTTSPEEPATDPAPTIDLSRPIPGGSLHGTPRPPLENTGTDYVAITKSLIANFRWLTENPDLSTLSDVLVPGTPSHDERIPAYQYLIDHRYSWADEGYQVLSVDVVDIRSDVVALRLVDRLEFERLVDGAGRPVRDVRRRDPMVKTWNALLAADSAGRWRIAAWSQHEDPVVEP